MVFSPVPVSPSIVDRSSCGNRPKLYSVTHNSNNLYLVNVFFRLLMRFILLAQHRSWTNPDIQVFFGFFCLLSLNVSGTWAAKWLPVNRPGFKIEKNWYISQNTENVIYLYHRLINYSMFCMVLSPLCSFDDCYLKFLSNNPIISISNSCPTAHKPMFSIMWACLIAALQYTDISSRLYSALRTLFPRQTPNPSPG